MYWVSGGLKLTTPSNLVPRLRMSGTYLHFCRLLRGVTYLHFPKCLHSVTLTAL
jgi:hypothetical protein